MRRADAFGAHTRFIAQKSSSCFRIIFTSQYCVALALCLGHLLLCKLPSVKCARSLSCSQLLSVNAPRHFYVCVWFAIYSWGFQYVISTERKRVEKSQKMNTVEISPCVSFGHLVEMTMVLFSRRKPQTLQRGNLSRGQSPLITYHVAARQLITELGAACRDCGARKLGVKCLLF